MGKYIALGIAALGLFTSCALFQSSYIDVGKQGSAPAQSEMTRGKGGRPVLALTPAIKEIRYNGFKFANPFDGRIEIPVARNSAFTAEWQTSEVLPRDYRYYCTAMRSKIPESLAGQRKNPEALKKFYDANFAANKHIVKYESRNSEFHGTPALEYTMEAEYAEELISIRMRGFFLIDPNAPNYTFELVSCETYDSRTKRDPTLAEITEKFFNCFDFIK